MICAPRLPQFRRNQHKLIKTRADGSHVFVQPKFRRSVLGTKILSCTYLAIVNKVGYLETFAELSTFVFATTSRYPRTCEHVELVFIFELLFVLFYRAFRLLKGRSRATGNCLSVGKASFRGREFVLFRKYRPDPCIEQQTAALVTVKSYGKNGSGRRRLRFLRPRCVFSRKEP